MIQGSLDATGAWVESETLSTTQLLVLVVMAPNLGPTTLQERLPGLASTPNGSLGPLMVKPRSLNLSTSCCLILRGRRSNRLPLISPKGCTKEPFALSWIHIQKTSKLMHKASLNGP